MTPWLTCLFTATSATCVTGLVLVDTAVHWSIFGQAVILLLLQLGGLGFVTLISIIPFALHRRIGLSQRLVMASAMNLDRVAGVVRVVRHALLGTMLVEGIGAVLLAIRFVPQFDCWVFGFPFFTASLPSVTVALIFWAFTAAPTPVWRPTRETRWCWAPSWPSL